ncbi:hypothetical protein MCEMIH15_00562 [Caulobacteraceae bacterium]
MPGEGPPFIKYGPRLVRYLITALDGWEQDRVFANTIQYGPVRRGLAELHQVPERLRLKVTASRRLRRP